jgi:hypothetical protein
MLYGFTEIKDYLFSTRCAIKFYINVINSHFVYRRFSLLKKWTKFRIKCFLFDSERASGIIFNRRPPIKMVDFHGEVTFISVFDGIRDIFKVGFIMQLASNNSNVHRLLFKCDIYYSDVTIDQDHRIYLQEPRVPIYDWI